MAKQKAIIKSTALARLFMLVLPSSRAVAHLTVEFFGLFGTAQIGFPFAFALAP
jgi:hypothetical protein